MREEIKCKICGKTFKSKSGLAGHMKIEHGVMKRVTYPDEVAKRLEAIEHSISYIINILNKVHLQGIVKQSEKIKPVKI